MAEETKVIVVRPEDAEGRTSIGLEPVPAKIIDELLNEYAGTGWTGDCLLIVKRESAPRFYAVTVLVDKEAQEVIHNLRLSIPI